jgi:ribonuclease E
LTEPTAVDSEKDPFWDALADWDVDDPSSTSKSPPPTPVVPETPGERPSYERSHGGRGGRREDRGPRREGGRREGSRGGSRSEGRRDEGRGRRPEGGRGESRREEPSRSAPRSERKPPEPIEETEGFGAGLVEDEPFARSVAPEPVDDFDDDSAPIEGEAVEKAPERESEDESGEGPRRRRRRRGRRGRRGEGAAEAPPTSQPAPVEADFDEDDEDEGDEDEPLARTSPDEPAEEEGQGRPPRGRGRYGRRRRGDRPDESEFVFDFIEDDEAPAAAAVAEEDDDMDDEDSVEAMNYANVPSWEEAISYILNPSLVQLEGGSPPPQQKRGPGDSPKQTRHYGRRKP